MSDYPLALINALNDDYVKEYSYFYITSLFILFILGFYINSQNKRINRIEKYLEEINAEFREHYYFRCEEKLRTYFKESYDHLLTKINDERDDRLDDVESIKNNIIDMKYNIDEANKALTFTNSIVEDIQSIKKDIDSLNENYDYLDTTIIELREEHNIQENAYQAWIGTGEYVQEGNYKYTAEIKIVNKGLHTFGENKRWMESLDDASVAYRDLLIEQLKYGALRVDKDSNTYLNNMGSLIGFNNYKKNYPVLYTEINNDNSEINMSCHKFEWNNSIEIHIIGKKIYDNRPDNLREVQYQNQVLSHIIFIRMSYRWKKSLETC